jgi:TonB family protein
MDSANIEDFRDFLKAFPNGGFANAARRKYSLLAHDKLPPRVQQIELRYPTTARGDAFRARRFVILDVIVNSDGKAENVTYTRRSGVDAMDYAATSAARKATYLPAVDNGIPVQEHMSLRLEFHQVCSAAAASGAECFNFNNARGLGRP